MVFDWYLNGDESANPMSANAIAKRLTGLGFPTRGDKQGHVAKKHGYGVWQRATVIRILTNETYTGVWHYGKTKMMDDGRRRKLKAKRGLGKQVSRPPEEWIAVDVPAIISSETFSLAQKGKTHLKPTLAGHRKYQYLMKSRLTCAKCGYAMRGQVVRGKYKYYLCNGRRQVVSLCDLPSVPGDWIETLLWEWVKCIIESPENLRLGLEDVQDELHQANQALLDRPAIVEEQTCKHEQQLEKLLDLYLEGEFPRDLLVERKANLEQTISGLHRERDELSSHIQQVTVTDNQLAVIETFCAKIRDGLHQADFATRRRIIELLDVRGKVAPENEQKVLYLKCLIQPNDQQQVLHLQTLPLSNKRSRTPVLVAVRLALDWMQDPPGEIAPDDPLLVQAIPAG